MHIVAVFIASFIVVYLSLLWFRSKLLEKSDWTSDIWIVEVSNKCLLLLWIGYFTIRTILMNRENNIVKSVIERGLAIWNYLQALTGIDSFWRPVDVLLGLTLTWIIYRLIYEVMKKTNQYEKLWSQEFPEYNFPFQEYLVNFLNEKPKFGQNIYWLDGEWGTGKTHFLRTFFKEQKYKKLELYYVSCFGITSREQAEQVLIREIEERSSFGSLDYIPVVGSLIKWGFKTLGLNLMKKDSVVIFDDLERVVYSEKGNDDPKDYNDLLGFIDYLANHKNQKVIVVYNSTDMEQTKENIIKSKFSPIENKMLSVDEVIDKIIEKNGDLTTFSHQFLGIIYKIKINFEPENLRALVRDIRECRNVENSWEELEAFVLSYLDDILPILKDKEVFGRKANRPKQIDLFYWSEHIKKQTKSFEKHRQLYVELVDILRTKLIVYPNLRNLVLEFDTGFSFETMRDDSLLGQEILEKLIYKKKIESEFEFELFEENWLEVDRATLSGKLIEGKPIEKDKIVNYKLKTDVVEKIISEVTPIDPFNKEFVEQLYSREYDSYPAENWRGYLGGIVSLLREDLSNPQRITGSINSLLEDFCEYLLDTEEQEFSFLQLQIDESEVRKQLKNYLNTEFQFYLKCVDSSGKSLLLYIGEFRVAYLQKKLERYKRLLSLMWVNNLKEEVIDLIENLQEKRGKEFTEADREKITVYFDSQGENIA